LATEQSEATPFKSRFAPELWVSGAQYLAESMCSRKARKTTGKDLPIRFWNTAEWKREYCIQLRLAFSLLKIYSVEAIVKALRNKSCQNAYSLGAPWIDAEIAKEQARIGVQKKVFEEQKPDPVSPAQVEPPRPTFNSKPTPLSKLRDL
jgi:hypothetical protein